MGLTKFPKGIDSGNMKFGVSTITGLGTVATGLSGTPTVVVATLRNIGVAVGDPFLVQAVPASGGSVVFTVKQDDGTNAANAGTVMWMAFGTPV